MDDAIKTAKRYVLKLKQKGFDVSNAYLFGSYAKGTARKDSDIDVCVVSKSFGKDYLGEMVKLRSLTYDIDYRIEPIPLTPTDLADPYDGFSVEIMKFGIEIK